jgi:hypothetical protein
MAGKTRKRKAPPAGKKAPRPRYTLRLDTELNGRPSRRAKVRVVDRDDNTVASDTVDMESATDRRRAARRFAADLGLDAGKLEGRLAEEWHRLGDEHRRAHAKPPPGTDAAGDKSTPQTPQPAPTSPYFVRDGRVCRRTFGRNGEETGSYPLNNFDARIVSEEVLDDGGEDLKYAFVVEGTLASGVKLPPTRVAAGEFASLGWTLPAWGCGAVVCAGQGAKDHLRAALQELSGQVPRRVVYQHLGWRKIGGVWVFLHAGGCIAPPGRDVSVSVSVGGALSRFVLPPPPTGAALVAAVKADLELLDAAPTRLTYPVMGATYRAPLGDSDSSLHLCGRTGKGKSELVALGQQHYGAGMNRLGLPGAWHWTANALTELAFLANDCYCVIDDFKPSTSRYDSDRQQEKIDLVLRGKGNHAGRGRCRPDGSLREARPPRAFIVSTGEDGLRYESLQGRCVSLQVHDKEVNIVGLTPYQDAAKAGVYAAAMSGYIAWLATKYDRVRQELSQRHAVLRQQAHGLGGHSRTPGAIADLMLGIEYWLAFAEEVGAVSASDAKDLKDIGWLKLEEIAGEQKIDLSEQNPVRRFLKLLASAISSGGAHLVNRQGEKPSHPADPAAWGWRHQDPPAVTWAPQGRLIGWLDGDDVFLDPEATFAAVQKLGEEQGERLPLSAVQLHKRLHDAKLLVTREGRKLTTRRTLQGRERAVLHFARACLTSAEVGEVGGDYEK